MENVETVESRIKSATLNVEPEQVFELDCAGCSGSSLDGLFEPFTNLQVLDLANGGLTSLKGFPKLPNLSELNLTGNKISEGLELLEGCPKLLVLKLNSNQINDLDTIKPLAKLDELRELDLTGNDVCKTENFRGNVFDLVKSLVYLDGCDRENKEMEKENEDVDVEEGESEDEDDEEDGNEDEVGLSYLQKSELLDDDSKDYEAPEDMDDEDEEESDEDEDDESEEDDIVEEEIKQLEEEISKSGENTAEITSRRGRKRKQDSAEEEVKQA